MFAWLIKLRFSRYFEAFVIAVILIGALSAGLKTFPFANNYEWLFAAIDVGLTAIFCIEIIIRFLATETPKTEFFPGWMEHF